MFESLFKKNTKKEVPKNQVSETGWEPERKKYTNEVKVDSAAYSQAYQKWLNSRGAERSIQPPKPKDFPIGGKEEEIVSLPAEETSLPKKVAEEKEEKAESMIEDYDMDAFIEANRVWLGNMELGKEPKLEDFTRKKELPEVDVDAYRENYVKWLKNPASGPKPKKEDFPKKRP